MKQLLLLLSFAALFVLPMNAQTENSTPVEESATEVINVPDVTATPDVIIEDIGEGLETIENEAPRKINSIADLDYWRLLIDSILVVIFGYLGRLLPGFSAPAEKFRGALAGIVAVGLAYTFLRGDISNLALMKYAISAVIGMGVTYPIFQKIIGWITGLFKRNNNTPPPAPAA